jgi:hypothetical protein
LLRRPRWTLTVIIVFVLCAIVVGYASWNIVQLYDTGLYHIQAVKWFARYSVVPGLSNLHVRFGYNNSSHLFAAYTDAYWQGTAVHVANGFMLVSVLCQWFAEILSARTPRGRVRQVFCLLTLPFLMSKLWSTEVPSLSSDLPAAILCFVATLELISLPRASRDHTRLTLLLILALGAVATTTKLGGLSLFIVTAALALAVDFRGTTWRVRTILFGIPFALMFGWVARGVIMSGWLIYPVFGRLPLSWSVPTTLADDDLGNIQSWSRIFGKPPSEVFGHGTWHWLTPWLDVFRQSHEFVLLLVAVAASAWRGAYRIGASSTRRAGEVAAVVACCSSILQWFVGAPDLRYGAYLFWLLPAVLLAPLIVNATQHAASRSLVFIASLLFVNWAGGFAFQLDAVVPKLWGRPPAPRPVHTRIVRSTAGTQMLAPTSGDQCWDAPLPCTPLVRDQIERTPGSISSGYLPGPVH